MKNKKITSNIYTIEDIKWFPKEKTFRYVTLDNEYLFALKPSGVYKTKIKESDLPKWYCKGVFYRRQGFFNCKDVKYVKYIPMYINHSLRDDCLLISYDKPIIKSKDIGNSCLDYDNVDETIWGRDLIKSLLYIKKYSNYDIEPIKEEIWNKILWLKDNYPKCFKSEVKSREEFFNIDIDN